MRNFRGLFYTVAAIMLLSGVSWLAYALFKKLSQPSESPFNAIPGNSAMIIQLNRAGNLLDELNRSNLLWKELARIPGINSVKTELHYVDSVSKKNEEISKIFQQHQILISITLSGRSDFGALYLTSVGGINPESYITDFAKELVAGHATLTQAPYATTRLHRIQGREGNKAFYFAVYKGVFMGSFHADLVKRSIDRLLLNTPMAASAGFRKVEASAGKKVDANIYINFRFFSLVLSGITNDAVLPDLIKFASFADWSGLDLIIKKDELLFNGTTFASDSSQQFLSLFSDQKPQKKQIAAILPDQTLYFTVFGWSDPARFSQKYQNRPPRDENYTPAQTAVLTLIDRYQLNINEYFLPWMGNEGCLFMTENPATFVKIPFIAFHTRDTVRTTRSLRSLADTLGLKTDSSTYRGHRIYKVPLPAFIPALFGELFSKVDVKCFAYLSDYVVFATNVKDLETVIQSYTEQATLINDKTFTEFDTDLPEKSNVYSYFNSYKAIHTVKSYLIPAISDQFNSVMDSLRKFRSVAFQFSNADGLFYSNVFLKYYQNLGSEGPLNWQARLDSTLSGPPKLIPVTRSGEQAIMVYDSAGTLYMVSPEGHIRWKLHLMGKLMGSIHSINLNGNDSLLLIFNTDTHLYLLHADGTFADKYPMRFPLHATNGITVVREPWNRTYKIMVAFQDNRVYSFTLDGISVQTWKRPKMNNEIRQPVTLITSGNKFRYFITDESGNTQITDLAGNQVINPEPKFTHAPYAGFYLNRSVRKGTYVTAGPTGKVLFMQDNGRINEVTLNLFSPAFRFFYEDISDNDYPEFIFIDRDKIYYYDRNYKLTYSYTFRRAISTPPFLLRGTGSKVMIGLVVPETRELFLFDKHGFRELEPGISGNTPFDVGILTKDGAPRLIVGDGKYLKSYRLTQP